jgi:[protein-PII] uridylyltransferase
LEGIDRLGLLAEVAITLSNLNLDIGSARVSTFGEKVIDTFYITDLIGHQISSPQRRGRIRNAILAVMDRNGQNGKDTKSRKPVTQKGAVADTIAPSAAK